MDFLGLVDVMDTVFCVYNLAKRVFLSSKVTVADTVNQPLRALKDLVALDAESGLWLTPLHGKPTIPKLFPYDFAYLDKDFRVLEIIEVVPTIEFPPFSPEVSTAIVLPPETFRNTQTQIGDALMICPQAEADQRLAATKKSAPTKRWARLSLDGAPEPAVGSLLPAETSNPAQNNAAADPGSAKTQPAVAESAAPTQATRSVANPKDHEKPPDKPQSPSVTISEVVIEQRVSGTEHRAGLEDLFANWVDSPTAPPSWIAQKARDQETGSPSGEKAAANPARETELAQKTSSRSSDSVPGSGKESTSPTDRKPVPPESSASAKPVSPQQTAQTPPNTFTVAQYGMWRVSTVSTPTGMGPAAAMKSSGPKAAPGQNLAKKDGTPKREEPTKKEAVRPAVKTDGMPSAPSAFEEAKRPENRRAATGPAQKVSSAEQKPSEPQASPTPSNPIADSPSKKADSPAEKPAPRWERKPSSLRASGSGLPANPDDETSPIQRNTNQSSNAPESQSSRPAPADFAATLQQKLDRTQGKAAAENTETVVSVSKAASEAPQAFTKGEPGMSATPERSDVQAKETKKVTATPTVGSTATTPPRFFKPKPEQDPNLKAPVERTDSSGKNGKQLEGLGAKFKRWLTPAPSSKSDRRRATRRYVPGMVAHYYTGGAPKPHDVADISMTGMYVLTDDRWVPDTMIRMTLQKPCARGEKKQSITVLSRIVRRGSDGVATEFVMEESLDSGNRDILPLQATDRLSLARFL